MRCRYLDNSGLAVSSICFGVMTFSQPEWSKEENESIDILDAFYDCGGIFLYTADQSNQSILKFSVKKRRIPKY